MDNNEYINRILHGDCLELMSQIKDKSVDMILCDLPYGITRNKWDEVIPLEKLWEQYNRIIKDNGAIVLTAVQPFTSKLVISNLEMFKYSLVWEKEVPNNPLEAKRRIMRWHEDILIFYRKLPSFNPQMEIRPEKNKRNNKPSSFKSDSYEGTFIKTPVLNDEKYPSSVRKVNSVRGKEKVKHSTQKPVKLFEWLIKTFTNEGDLILDNCIGSGTTSVACINTNRNYIGMEQEYEYIEIANKRIEEAKLKIKVSDSNVSSN